MQQREELARRSAGDQAVDRVLAAATPQWLPRGAPTRSAQQVVAAPIAGARFTVGTLLVALREAPLVIVVLSAVFLASETWQFFARLDGWEYAKVIGGVIFLLALILVFGLREEARLASRLARYRLTSFCCADASGHLPIPLGIPLPVRSQPGQATAAARVRSLIRAALECSENRLGFSWNDQPTR